MRDLTEEELSLAPEWATHYETVKGGYIIFQSEVFSVWYDSKISRFDKKTNNEFLNDLSELRALPKKPFDISEHKFSDKDLVANLNGEIIELEVTYQQWGGHINGYSEEEKTVNINKQDTIAIAKTLGVTGEDLK